MFAYTLSSKRRCYCYRYCLYLSVLCVRVILHEHARGSKLFVLYACIQFFFFLSRIML